MNVKPCCNKNCCEWNQIFDLHRVKIQFEIIIQYKKLLLTTARIVTLADLPKCSYFSGLTHFTKSLYI